MEDNEENKLEAMIGKQGGQRRLQLTFKDFFNVQKGHPRAFVTSKVRT